MTAVLIEHGQYVDDAGIPISLGSLYIGTNGADPVATAPSTIIYSDRDLTVPIANPQPLDEFGRTDNKVWVSGLYSIQVNDSAAVQKFQDLDAGSAGSTSNTSLFVTSIVGGDTITGVTSDPISAYVGNQQYVFETVAVSSGAVTLNIDGVGAKAIVKNNTDPLVSGDFADNQVIIVAYNATNDDFEWTNPGEKSNIIVGATITVAGIVEKTTPAEVPAWASEKYPDMASIILGAVKQTLTDQANIAFDTDLGWNATVTLAGNRTLDNPTNVNEGAMGFIEVIQDGGGTNTLALGSNYKTANGTGLTLTTTGGATDVLFWAAISTTSILITNVLDIS